MLVARSLLFLTAPGQPVDRGFDRSATIGRRPPSCHSDLLPPFFPCVARVLLCSSKAFFAQNVISWYLPSPLPPRAHHSSQTTPYPTHDPPTHRQRACRHQAGPRIPPPPRRGAAGGTESTKAAGRARRGRRFSAALVFFALLRQAGSKQARPGKRSLQPAASDPCALGARPPPSQGLGRGDPRAARRRRHHHDDAAAAVGVGADGGGRGLGGGSSGGGCCDGGRYVRGLSSRVCGWLDRPCQSMDGRTNKAPTRERPGPAPHSTRPYTCTHVQPKAAAAAAACPPRRRAWIHRGRCPPSATPCPRCWGRTASCSTRTAGVS